MTIDPVTVRGVFGRGFDPVPVILGSLSGHKVNFDLITGLELGVFPARHLDDLIIAIWLVIGQLEMTIVLLDGHCAVILVVLDGPRQRAGRPNDCT